MSSSTLTSKGQTTVPKAVRVALSLEPGDQVRYVIGDGEVRMLKARPAASLYGVLARPGHAPVSLEAMDEAIAAEASRRAGAKD
jgi:AbrB family looped-hinge helix DNA binding protein